MKSRRERGDEEVEGVDVDDGGGQLGGGREVVGLHEGVARERDPQEGEVRRGDQVDEVGSLHVRRGRRVSAAGDH